jgi:hypothetical protein
MPTEKAKLPKRERRAETRAAAHGSVRLRGDGLLETRVEGRLLDTSAHGFRAVHDCPTMASGQIVNFEHSGAAGRARVMWTRIHGEQVQSGFYVLG